MQNFLNLWLNAGAQITHGGQVQRPRQNDVRFENVLFWGDATLPKAETMTSWWVVAFWCLKIWEIRGFTLCTATSFWITRTLSWGVSLNLHVFGEVGVWWHVSITAQLTLTWQNWLFEALQCFLSITCISVGLEASWFESGVLESQFHGVTFSRKAHH